jgi:uncharacterized NAD(P)/FAD-binding protein YdhS
MQCHSHGAASAARAPASSPDDGHSATIAGNKGVPRVIAIVGAGFSGTAVAIQLLRQPPRDATRIVLIDPREEIGAGVAYVARDYPYPLNVAAGQMSLDARAPRDFLEYAESQDIHASEGDYLPRQVYGAYLRHRFAGVCAAAPPHVSCAHHRAAVLRLKRGDGGQWELWLDDGTALRADDVVLALGNAAPACPGELSDIARTDCYVSDPWSIGSCGDLDSVLLVGSGLTMIDAALRLAAVRPRVRHIRVLSRHGLMPLPQATASRLSRRPEVCDVLEAARGSTRALVRAFRDLSRETEAAGGDWREVLALARSQLPSQWQSLDEAQRARFLRHARSLWDVHRHRAPTGPLGAVQALARLGVLELHAGRLLSARLVDDAVEVEWRPRGASKPRAWLVDRVVNCTGPDARAANLSDPLVISLLSSGLIRADVLGLGIDVSGDGRVISRDGQPVDRLYYIGPWLRARDWESTAVPELREHALSLALRLAELPAAALSC